MSAPSVYFLSNTQDFVFAPLENISTNEKEGFSLTCRLSTSVSPTLQWKVWLKEVLIITENNFKMATGYYLVLRILKPSSQFYWTHSPTTFSVNFWLGSLFFLVMTSWFSFRCLKQRFLKPVSKFWDLQTFQRFKFSFFSATQPQFSLVCLSSWWEVTPISLAFGQKQALVPGRSGIPNSPIT